MNEPNPGPQDTPGSVVPLAKVVIELSGGVVSGLFVVKSSLWKHTTPTPVGKKLLDPAQSSAANALPAHVVNASTHAAHCSVPLYIADLLVDWVRGLATRSNATDTTSSLPHDDPIEHMPHQPVGYSPASAL